MERIYLFLSRCWTLLCLTVAISVHPVTAEIYYYHNDHLGTPQVMTDASANVVWQAKYTPFGEAEIVIETVTNNLRFTGQYYDDETGLHYNYFRDYDPELGRYIQSDRLGLFDGPNTYGYAHQNPIMYTDPTGEFVPQLLGFVVGAGLEYLTNDCATASDIFLAGALGSVGGGFGNFLQRARNARSAYQTGLNAGRGKGLSAEQAHALRRNLGAELKKQTPQPLREIIYRRNLKAYGDKLGPKFDPKKHSNVDKTLTDTNPLANSILNLPSKGLPTGGALLGGGFGSSVAGGECGCN